MFTMLGRSLPSCTTEAQPRQCSTETGTNTIGQAYEQQLVVADHNTAVCEHAAG